MTREEQIIQAKKMWALERLTYKEIAARLGVTISRVSGWLNANKSKRKWRDIYKEPGASNAFKHRNGPFRL